MSAALLSGGGKEGNILIVLVLDQFGFQPLGYFVYWGWSC